MDEKTQIEEMAKVLCPKVLTEYCASGICTNPNCLVNAKALETLYNAGYRKQSEWISADNSPETYRDEYGELIPFLVCCNGTKYPFRALYDGTNWGDGIGRLDVTCWMPLPEPPKGI